MKQIHRFFLDSFNKTGYLLNHFFYHFQKIAKFDIDNKVRMIFVKKVDIFIIYIIGFVIFYIMKQVENSLIFP